MGGGLGDLMRSRCLSQETPKPRRFSAGSSLRRGAHEHIIVRSWQSLIVSAQSLTPGTVPTNPIGFPAWYFSSVCLGHVALFIKHADDRPVRARAVLRVRDRVADCVGSCIPDWAESQPTADQIKAVPGPCGDGSRKRLGGGWRTFPSGCLCFPKARLIEHFPVNTVDNQKRKGGRIKN